jgi:hypothetical protein
LNFENGFDNNTYFSHVVASNLKTYLDFEYGFDINTYFSQIF